MTTESLWRAEATPPPSDRPFESGGVASALLRLAGLLRYPTQPVAVAAGDPPDVVAFFEEIAHVVPEGVEELYTRTFDLNPVATLEIGWHLWGEQYERGRFLADLRELQERMGLDAGNELPDHLTVLLATIAHLDDPSVLVAQIAPALEKIAQPLEEQGNPYRHLIRAAQHTALSTQHSPAGGAA